MPPPAVQNPTMQDQGFGSYEWMTKDGLSWTLEPKAGEPLKLKVGEECIHYETGHKVAEIQVDQFGKVTGILGPNGDFYTKMA